jgi:hypothetical protein
MLAARHQPHRTREFTPVLRALPTPNEAEALATTSRQREFSWHAEWCGSLQHRARSQPIACTLESELPTSTKAHARCRFHATGVMVAAAGTSPGTRHSTDPMRPRFADENLRDASHVSRTRSRQGVLWFAFSTRLQAKFLRGPTGLGWERHASQEGGSTPVESRCSMSPTQHVDIRARDWRAPVPAPSRRSCV